MIVLVSHLFFGTDIVWKIIGIDNVFGDDEWPQLKKFAFMFICD